MQVQGSLETRFYQSTSDYADVLHTGVIEQAKSKAVQSGLRKLIDDTTAGVLLFEADDNSVWCWLTGIKLSNDDEEPRKDSRKDYTGTEIRYAIALHDEPGTMRKWAGILCRLYSDKEQKQSLIKFLDSFIQDNRSVKTTLTFDNIAKYLEDKDKVQPVPTTCQIPAGCKFVVASYLAQSDDNISSVISKSDTGFWHDGDKGAFWNGSGFSECSISLKKKGMRKSAKKILMTSPEASKRLGMASPESSTRSLKASSKKWKIAGATAVLLLLAGLGVKLHSDVQTKEFDKLTQCVVDLRGSLDTLQVELSSLQQAVEDQKSALKNLQDKSEVLRNRAASVGKERQAPGTRDKKQQNQSPKKEQNPLTQEISLLQQAAEDQKSALKSLQDKSDVLHNRAASVEKERQTLGTRVKNLENQLPKKD